MYFYYINTLLKCVFTTHVDKILILKSGYAQLSLYIFKMRSTVFFSSGHSPHIDICRVIVYSPIIKLAIMLLVEGNYLIFL